MQRYLSWAKAVTFHSTPSQYTSTSVEYTSTSVDKDEARDYRQEAIQVHTCVVKEDRNNYIIM